MRIVLRKKHPAKNYTGNNAVLVRCKECPEFKCFHAHDWSYTLASGKLVHDFRCNRREYHGCPDAP